MTTKEYDDFVEQIWFHGAGFDPADHGNIPELAYLGLAISGESGELVEKLKKAYRQNGGIVKDEVVILELGDILYYVSKLANYFGYSLDDVMNANVAKLKDRVARFVLYGEGDNR